MIKILMNTKGRWIVRKIEYSNAIYSFTDLKSFKSKKEAEKYKEKMVKSQ